MHQRFALGGFKALRAMLSRELILIKRSRFLYIFRTAQVGRNSVL